MREKGKKKKEGRKERKKETRKKKRRTRLHVSDIILTCMHVYICVCMNK